MSTFIQHKKWAIELFERSQQLLASRPDISDTFFKEHPYFPSEAGIVNDSLLAGMTGLSSEFRDHLSNTIIDRIICPIYYPNKLLIGFVARVFDSEQGSKYLFRSIHPSIPSSVLLYGLDEAVHHCNEEFYLVEGVTDVIALRTNQRNAMASLGAHLTFAQAAQICFFTNDVIIAFDGDKSGLKGITDATLMLAQFEVLPRVCIFPQGLDPADTVASRGDIVFYIHSVIEFYLKLMSTRDRKSYAEAFASEEHRRLLREAFKL